MTPTGSPPIPTILAWSGGKDSLLALERLRAEGRHDVRALVTAVTGEYDRVSIHGVRRTILLSQARALALPVVEARLSPRSSNADYERAWAEALRECAALVEGARHVAYGDLFLADVRAYRDAFMARLDLEPVYPLWSEPTDRLARRFVDAGHRAILTCVDTTQLDGAFAGRDYDHALAAELPSSVDPCGERGEFHTCVVASPLFSEPIRVRRGERVLRDDRFQYCDLLHD